VECDILEGNKTSTKLIWKITTGANTSQKSNTKRSAPNFIRIGEMGASMNVAVNTATLGSSSSVSSSLARSADCCYSISSACSHEK
jgi:hypothetical protein